MNWTDEQLSVITSRGQNLLVSAAAGSGKTAVLVERILEKILDEKEHTDLDHLLVVTFTNAAAAQLRERIRTAVEKRLSENPEDMAAVRQMALIGSDHIQTIDRFCREVVLDYYDAIGVDPSFRIADKGESELLKSDVAAQVIEEAYAQGGEEFREFSASYAPGKSDRALEDMLLSFYDYSTASPFPKTWRHDCVRRCMESAENSEWLRELYRDVKTTLRDMRQKLTFALSVCEEAEGPAKYAPAITSDLALVDTLLSCEDFDEGRAVFSRMSFQTLGRITKKDEVDEEKKEYVKKLRSSVKDQLGKLRDDVFSLSLQETEERVHESGRALKILADLADRFEEEFCEAKRVKNMADFSDVEHWALQILLERDEEGEPVLSEDGGYVPSETASELADFFDEIYIDEYQDSNPVQELLLWSVSKEARRGGHDHNRFMVGDVKQSIYRFRMAEPAIFTQKYRTYPTDEDSVNRRIDLHSNFRSRAQVLGAVNMVFRQIMRREVGDIDYDDDQALRAGAVFPEPAEADEGAGAGQAGDARLTDYTPELILALRGEGAEKDVKTSEAMCVADRIESIVGYMDVTGEGGKLRKARYGDIAILLRTGGSWAEAFSKVLTDRGIPNESGAATGYFDTPEVRTILAYLSCVDNPRQDIALAASLRSQIGGFSDEELSRIRTDTAGLSLYDAVRAYEKDGGDEKLRDRLHLFLERLNRHRALVKDTPIHLLLWQILSETVYTDKILAMQDGKRRKANLDLLCDKAMDYEKTSYRGLFHFVRYIKRLREASMEIGGAVPLTDGDDRVRIMTMHKSKGLEFPIVFVSGLNKRRNLSDASGTVVMHPALGAAMDYVDPVRRIRYKSAMKKVLEKRILTDSMGEELRVLYVAMTRAKEKLILTACAENFDTAFRRAAQAAAGEEERLPVSDITAAPCYLDWLLMALRRHEGEGLIRVTDADESQELKVSVQTDQAVRLEKLLETDPDRVYDGETAAFLRKRLTGTYPWPGHENMPGKVSVSELKKAGYEAELEKQEILAESAVMPYAQPGDRGTDGGAVMGTVYHRILAELDFEHIQGAQDLERMLETMVRCDKIEGDAARRIDRKKILHFLESDLGQRMKKAGASGKLYREMPFVIGRRADLIDPAWDGSETVLIQGIIDAYFIEDGRIILTDYKSDRVREGEEGSLVRRYLTQFELYARALKDLLQMEVAECWLYSLSLSKAIRVSWPS